jgi:trimeric autotransporter adhesin
MRSPFGSRDRRHKSMSVRSRSSRSEAGDTLIEVLCAVIVLGIASVAILFAFSTSIFGSSEYKGIANADTALRTAAEDFTSYLQQLPASSWAVCGGIQTGNSYSSVATNLPAGFTLQSVTATYWDGQTWTSTCEPNQAEFVTITLAGNGSTYTIETVVDDPWQPSGLPPVGTATHLAFLNQPSSTQTAGVTFTPPPVVAIEDSNNEYVSNFLTPISLYLVNSSGQTVDQNGQATTQPLACTAADSAGVVTFSGPGCEVYTIGSGYSFEAVAPDAAFATTAPGSTTDPAVPAPPGYSFSVVAGPPSQLAFTTTGGISPIGGTTGGTAFADQPQVTVEDAQGNVVISDHSTVTLEITPGTGPAGAVLSHCSASESQGVFTFTGCAINKDGSYTLTAIDGVLMSQPSNSFSVTTGPATQLIFTTSPANTSSGSSFGSTVVALADAGGNQETSLASPVTIALSINTYSNSQSGTLSCASQTTSSTTFLATFSGCNIAVSTSSEGQYTLQAKTTSGWSGTPNPLTGVSGNFSVAGTATQLAFVQSPQASYTGVAFGTQPTVQLEDKAGDPVYSANTTVTLAINSQPGAGSKLGCPLTTAVTALTNSAGLATFANCAITLPVPNTASTEGNYQLAASGTGLMTGYSGSFPVAGIATQLLFEQSPSNSSNGVAFGTQPVVYVKDAHGDLVTTSTAPVTLATYSSTGTGLGTLGCPTSTTVNAIGGIATFANCAVSFTVNSYQGTYTLQATSSVTPALTAGASGNFTVAGTASKLLFTTEPSSQAFGGTAFATQPVVTVQDASGDTVTSDASLVTLSTSPGTGASGGVLSPSCAGTETLGVVSFSGCSINLASPAGDPYTLVASDPTLALATATSSTIQVNVGPAAQLAFSTSPSNATAGVAFGTQPVIDVEDAGGNIVTGDSSAVTLSLVVPAGGTNGTGGTAPLSGCVGTEVGGVVTFTGCTTTTAGTNLYLLASDGQLETGMSSTFNVSPGPVYQLGIISSPLVGTSAATPVVGPITVQEQDQYGNAVTAGPSGLVVNLATSSTGTTEFSSSAGGSATTSVTIPNELSSINFFYGDTQAGSPLITVSSPGLVSGTQFETITPAAASKLAFVQQPSNTVAGATMNPAPTVQVEDAYGNAVADNAFSITLSPSANSIFSGATVSTNSAGLATFPVVMHTAGTGYTLTAAPAGTGTGVANATSIGTFNITATTASKLVLSAVSGISPPVDKRNTWTGNGNPDTVTITDQYGNAVAATSVAGVKVNLTSSSGNGVFSTTGSGSGSAPLLVTIPDGSSSVNFYYEDSTGSPTITATYSSGTPSGLTAGTQGWTVDSTGNGVLQIADDAEQPQASSGASSMSVNSADVPADGTSSSSVSVTIDDAAGAPLANQSVVLTADSGQSLITTLGGTTSASGVATFEVRDTHAESVTYEAEDLTGHLVPVDQGATVTFVPGPVSSSTTSVVAAPSSVIANGENTSNVSVTVEDANQNVIAGQTIVLSATAGSSLVTTTSGTTNASGIATFAVSDTHAEAVTYMAQDASDPGITFDEDATVTFVPGPVSAQSSTVSSSQASVVADGTSASTITVDVVDADGNPISGQIVSLDASGGASLITPIAATTSANGAASFTVTNTQAEAVTYTANDTSGTAVLIGQPVSVTFVPGPVSAGTSTVVATPATVLANGTSSSLVTVTVTDADDNAIAGQAVTLSAENGSSIITTISGTTNASGAALFTVIDNTPEQVTYSAQDITGTAVTLLQSASVNFMAGPVSASMSSVTATNDAVLANGVSTSTITVTLKDANAHPVVGQTVVLSASSGSSVVTTVSGTTNSSGVATFAVSDTEPDGLVVYTARDTTAEVTINQTAKVTFI